MGLIYEKKDRVAYLTLNRPETLNSLDSDMVVELFDAWVDYRDDNDCSCAIITGAGDKSFCAGLDLAKMIPLLTGAKKPATENEKKVASNPKLVDDASLRNFVLYKPVVAAINGFAIAAGMELVQGTDIRIASETARFGLREAKLGLFPLGGSTVRLPRQIPYCKAMEIMLTGELIGAEEALRIGFVNKVVPQGKVIEEAERMAYTIARNGPLSLRCIKESVISCMGLTFWEGLRKESELGSIVFNSKDVQEGPRAFVEKREPHLTGQ